MAEQNQPTNPSPAASVDPPISAYPRRRSYKRWIFLAVFVVLVIAGGFLWHYLSGFESTDDAQVDVHLYPVSARITGYIQKVSVEDNQWVEAGATLVEIDPKDYQVALARAQATLDTSEATAKSSNIDVPVSSVATSSQLKFTSSDIRNAEAAIAAAEKQAAAAHARVLEAQAENVKTEDDVTRYRLLLAKEEVPKQIYDHAYAAAATDFAAVAAPKQTRLQPNKPWSKRTVASLRRRRTTKMPKPDRSASPPRAPKPFRRWLTYTRKVPLSNKLG